MKIRNLTIRSQLIAGFISVLLLVVLLGSVSFIQNGKMLVQAENLYQHSLKVRRAIGTLSADISFIKYIMRDVLQADSPRTVDSLNLLIEDRKNEILAQSEILQNLYIGPAEDIANLKKEIAIWNSLRSETIRDAREQKTDGSSWHTYNGNCQAVGMVVNEYLKKIDNYSLLKGNELYNDSIRLNNLLRIELITMIILILIISTWIGVWLFRNIRRPVEELTRAAENFHSGDLDSRSSYRNDNEFGILSDSFNRLADNIQQHIVISEQGTHFARLMLAENDLKTFFQVILRELLVFTGGQMAGAYLLNAAHNRYELYESIGLGNDAPQSIPADRNEGEIGTAVVTGKISHIRFTAENTGPVWTNLTGKTSTQELITIPVSSENRIICVISLSTINRFNPNSILLIESLVDMLSARIEGILAFRKVREFSDRLEEQNRQLESRKEELVTKSDELLNQNVELESQKSQLKEANQMKTTFLSTMSHELRTPLNSVIALSGVLSRRLKNKIPPEEYSYVEVIGRNGKNLLSMINNILDLSHIESGAVETTTDSFDVNELISDVLETVYPEAKQKRIKLIHGNASEKITIESDEDKCRHILINLIGNAIKFSEKGKVEVAAGIEEDKLKIEVRDTGIGIAPDVLPYIFDEFRQADGTTSRRFGGSGLGLAISKRYSDLLGGEIRVSSELGKGSAFTFLLPLGKLLAKDQPSNPL
jgi:signal transduction histidine kinase/HAMP domain-containing protein